MAPCGAAVQVDRTRAVAGAHDTTAQPARALA
jgi:hypothetical protein